MLVSLLEELNVKSLLGEMGKAHDQALTLIERALQKKAREAYAAGALDGYAAGRSVGGEVFPIDEKARKKYPLPPTRLRRVEPDPDGGPVLFTVAEVTGEIAWKNPNDGAGGWHTWAWAGSPIPTTKRIRLWAEMLDEPYRLVYDKD